MKVKPTYFQSLVASWVPLPPWQCRLVDYLGAYECLTVQRVEAARRLLSKSDSRSQELLRKYVQSIRKASRLLTDDGAKRIVSSFLSNYDKSKS